MSPRHNRRRREESPAVQSGSLGSRPERHSGPDGEWFARSVPAVGATKSYVCPGCGGDIAPGTAHVVAWPAETPNGVENRRHWHAGCWRARHRRRPIA